MTLAVSEVFGPTVQGEGLSLGRPTMFLRLAACNLACVWCDTKYTWDWKHYDKSKEVHQLTAEDVARSIRSKAPQGWLEPMLVISGGEPMLQQRALPEVLNFLPEYRVEVETAGTIAPTPEMDERINQFTVSLKLQHSGNLLSKRYRPLAIIALRDTGRAVWKFVAQQPSDLVEVDELVREYGLEPVYIMPEGTDHATIMEHARALLPAVIDRGWTLTPRLHIDLWGARRGV